MDTRCYRLQHGGEVHTLVWALSCSEKSTPWTLSPVSERNSENRYKKNEPNNSNLSRGIHVRPDPLRILSTIFPILLMLLLPSDPSGATHLKIISFNAGTGKNPVPNLDHVIEAIQATGVPADVLLAQEIPWSVKHDDLARKLGFKHFVSGLILNPRCTRAIFSRTKLIDPFVIETERSPQKRIFTSAPGALCATTVIRETHVLLCSVHLETMRNEMSADESIDDTGVIFRYVQHELFNQNIRSRSVGTIIEKMSEIAINRVIIAGDFNTFPFSKAIRKMGSVYNDAFSFSTAFFKGSYIDSPFCIKPRLDHIFHSPNMSARKSTVHDITSGDHVPISTIIRID
ncbi:hypothetical protein D3OALGB2SA_4832 [Olavius algarvensis associated proteobacterium Delta 3]|nr:hypothetical protein D3OALGB2SA_4832 [Olavius algarvensis associated proteobacterium Delta 3]